MRCSPYVPVLYPPLPWTKGCLTGNHRGGSRSTSGPNYKAELPSEPSSRALQCFSAPPARFINCLSLMHRQGHGQALAVQCPNPLCIPCWFQLSHYPRCRLTSPLTCLTTSSPDVRLCQQTGCICGSCSPEHVSRVLLVLAALLVPGKVGNTAARLSFHATRASDKTRSRALLG